MSIYNKDKMTELDFTLLKNKYKEGELQKILEMIDADYPVQYAIGDVDFLDCKIKVDERVLIPRFETELLVCKLEKYVGSFFNHAASLVDICTGSGCIAISYAKRFPQSFVVAVDKSIDALEVTSENATINGVNIKTMEKDVLSDMTFDCKFDVLVSNPPYVKWDEEVSSNTRYEPQMALYPGEDDIIFYRRILASAKEILNEKSIIAFEIGSSQGARILKLVEKAFPKAKVSLEKDYAGLDRFIFIFNDL